MNDQAVHGFPPGTFGFFVYYAFSEFLASLLHLFCGRPLPPCSISVFFILNYNSYVDTSLRLRIRENSSLGKSSFQ